MNKLTFAFSVLLLLGGAGVSSGRLHAAAVAGPAVPAAAQDRDRDDWRNAPSEWDEMRRRGFHEGMESAQRDMERGRKLDFDDSRMYKHPPVEGRYRAAFREGFKEGYHRATEHMRHERDYDRR